MSRKERRDLNYLNFLRALRDKRLFVSRSLNRAAENKYAYLFSTGKTNARMQPGVRALKQ